MCVVLMRYGTYFTNMLAKVAYHLSMLLGYGNVQLFLGLNCFPVQNMHQS